MKQVTYIDHMLLSLKLNVTVSKLLIYHFNQKNVGKKSSMNVSHCQERNED